MKILFFRSATFQWDKNSESPYFGLICLCHVEKGDMIKTDTISGVIQSENKEERTVVLVPFPFLDSPENKMPCLQATRLLERLKSRIPGAILATGYKYNIFELCMSVATFGIPDGRLLFESI